MGGSSLDVASGSFAIASVTPAYHRNEFAPKARQLIEDSRLSAITRRFGVSKREEESEETNKEEEEGQDEEDPIDIAPPAVR